MSEAVLFYHSPIQTGNYFSKFLPLSFSPRVVYTKGTIKPKFTLPNRQENWQEP
jgi:hypothetical protein